MKNIIYYIKIMINRIKKILIEVFNVFVNSYI